MLPALILVPYFMPPISWWAVLACQPRAQLATHIAFPRQQYANRAYLKGPHRVEAFAVPVLGRGSRQTLAQVQLSYAQPWPRQLIRTIENLYRRAPFYEHYAQPLFDILQQPENALLPLNLAIIELFIKQLGLPSTPELNTDAHPEGLLHWGPGSLPAGVQLQPYYQLFGPFVPDLSILDLVMNLGPQVLPYLRGCVRIKES